jgi:glycosyltransferase involved in cell wall biosynthesis
VKILLELERLRNPYSGLGQYCQHLALALAELPQAEQTTWQYLLPAHQIGTLGAEAHYIAVQPHHKFFPPATTTDIWHCLHQDSAYWPARNTTTRIVTTIHDLNFMERNDMWAIEKKRRLAILQHKINRSYGLVFISQFVRQQIEHHLYIPENILQKVIYNGIVHGALPQGEQPKIPQQPFVFSIGLHPKKNYHVLLPVLTQNSNLSWIVAGGDHMAYRQKMQQEAVRLGVAERLFFVGEITDAVKNNYYRNCEALLFPSLSEGFGMPVIEAMSFGKPVFLSTHTSLPEIGGSEAFYFQYFDPAHVISIFQQGMTAWAADAATRVARSQAWAAQFSWQKAAKEYWAFYEAIR